MAVLHVYSFAVNHRGSSACLMVMGNTGAAAWEAGSIAPASAAADHSWTRQHFGGCCSFLQLVFLQCMYTAV
jgi:hypothetical protein